MGMDNTEAIKRIKDHIRVHHIGEYPHIKIAEALNMAISALANDNNVGSKWIPVAEGCPTAHSGCIVYRNNNLGSHYSMVCYTPALGFHYYDSEYGDITLDDVTHWMPLPEPPKEE